MNFGRRKLLQSVVPVALAPFTIRGEPIKTAGVFTVKAEQHFMMFVDAMVVDVHELAECAHYLPSGTVIQIIPLKLRPGQTVPEAVEIYELDNPGT